MKETPYFLVRSVQKAFSVLEILCNEGEMGVSKVGKRINLKKSNVHRLLATLEYIGYVEKNIQTLNYRPTVKVFELGSSVLNQPGELRVVVHPFLEDLGRQFRETNNLGVLDRGEVVYIDKVESSRSLKMDLKIGRRAPAYCTALGKVLLAHLPEADLEKYLKSYKLTRRTPRTITSSKALKKVLKGILAQGYAIDDQELSEGITCISAPVLDYTGKVIAAISISGPSLRMRRERLVQLRGPLIAATEKISKALGYINQGKAGPTMGG